MARAAKKKQGTVIQRALENTVRRLESRIESIEHDNSEARAGWAKLYAVMFPQAIDGPRLGMPINGTIQTIIRAVETLRIDAGVKAGKNAN